MLHLLLGFDICHFRYFSYNTLRRISWTACIWQINSTSKPDGISLVPLLESFRLDDADGDGIVVPDGVVEEGDVAAQLDDGKDSHHGRDKDYDAIFTEHALSIVR